MDLTCKLTYNPFHYLMLHILHDKLIHMTNVEYFCQQPLAISKCVWWYVCLHAPSDSAAFLLDLMYTSTLLELLAMEFFHHWLLCQHWPLHKLQYANHNNMVNFMTHTYAYTYMANMLLAMLFLHNWSTYTGLCVCWGLLRLLRIFKSIMMCMLFHASV